MYKNSHQILEQRIEFERLITDVPAQLIKAEASEGIFSSGDTGETRTSVQKKFTEFYLMEG